MLYRNEMESITESLASCHRGQYRSAASKVTLLSLLYSIGPCCSLRLLQSELPPDKSELVEADLSFEISLEIKGS